MFEQKCCFAPKMFEQKSCFVPKMFEQKSSFASEMFELIITSKEPKAIFDLKKEFCSQILDEKKTFVQTFCM